jgi:hypothetical protein
MASSTSFWASKTRQFTAHLRAQVDPDERAALASWLTPDELALFDRMHPADQRHGLDVAAALREDDVEDRDVLVAGLVHDAGKGRTGVWPRVAYALGRQYGSWIWRVAGVVPGGGPSMARLRDHAELSAVLAAQAGCSERTVGLVRHQDAPVDPVDGRKLQLADEAN